MRHERQGGEPAGEGDSPVARQRFFVGILDVLVGPGAGPDDPGLRRALRGGGALFSAFSFGFTAGSIFGGSLADRLDRRVLFLGSFSVLFLVFGAVAAAPVYWTLWGPWPSEGWRVVY